MRPTQLCRRQLHLHFLGDPRGRNRHQPALRRYRHSMPRTQLDIPRLLRTLVPGAALQSVSGPLINLSRKTAARSSLSGERDEEHQFGVTIPYRGWVLDADTYQTSRSNFLDHNNIGASISFLPHHRGSTPSFRDGNSRCARPTLASRPDSSRLFQSDRRMRRPNHRRPCLSERSLHLVESTSRLCPSITTSATRSTSAATSRCPGILTHRPTSITARDSPTERTGDSGWPYQGDYFPATRRSISRWAKTFGENYYGLRHGP